MKDWKGNSNSAHAAIAAHNGKGKSDRQEDDFYATDPEALQKLLDHCSAWLHNMLDMIKPSEREISDKIHVIMPIWECACGNGNLSEVLIKNGFIVWSTDIKDRGYGQNRDIDFLNIIKTNNLVILTNPPYSLATEFIENALKILPEGGLYISLMNITYLHGIDRYKRVYSKCTLREVYVFSKKIHVFKNNIPTGHTSMCVYAWYVFQKGYYGQPTLYWL